MELLSGLNPVTCWYVLPDSDLWQKQLGDKNKARKAFQAARESNSPEIQNTLFAICVHNGLYLEDLRDREAEFKHLDPKIKEKIHENAKGEKIKDLFSYTCQEENKGTTPRTIEGRGKGLFLKNSSKHIVPEAKAREWLQEGFCYVTGVQLRDFNNHTETTFYGFVIPDSAGECKGEDDPADFLSPLKKNFIDYVSHLLKESQIIFPKGGKENTVPDTAFSKLPKLWNACVFHAAGGKTAGTLFGMWNIPALDMLQQP